MFLHNPSKFGKFSLKIGGEIICQSWPLFNLFSQLTHCALLQLFSQVIQKVIFTKYLYSDGNHNIRSKIKILFLESLLLSLHPCHICFVICFHLASLTLQNDWWQLGVEDPFISQRGSICLQRSIEHLQLHQSVHPSNPKLQTNY